MSHCVNPYGCLGTVKAGRRCAACHEYRRRHRGQERPERLLYRPDRQAADRCANPAGCRNPARPGGSRCSACYQWRRRHRGQERPDWAILKARTRQRRAAL